MWIFPSFIDCSKVKVSNGSSSQIQIFSDVKNSVFFTCSQRVRLSFSLTTFYGHSFFMERKKDSKSVSIASFTALTEADIDMIRLRGCNIVYYVFFSCP